MHQPDVALLYLQVSKAAAPVYVARLSALLTAHAHAISQGQEGSDRLSLDELLCALETAAAVDFAPSVADQLVASTSLVRSLHPTPSQHKRKIGRSS